MLIVDIANIESAEVEPDGKTAMLPCIAPDGSTFGVRMRVDTLAPIIASLVEARAYAVVASGTAAVPEKLMAKQVQSWEAGVSHAHDVVVLIFDRNTPKQLAYQMQPSTARAMGKCLIASARDVENNVANATRN